MQRARFGSSGTLLGVLLVATAVLGCKSSQQGVSTNYRSQWTTVNANTKATTDAAEAVLAADKLLDVKAASTNVDGTASAKKADGTKVSVGIKKKTDASSEVSVTVGTMGDPSLGAEYARRIKEKAEGK